MESPSSPFCTWAPPSGTPDKCRGGKLTLGCRADSGKDNIVGSDPKVENTAGGPGDGLEEDTPKVEMDV